MKISKIPKYFKDLITGTRKLHLSFDYVKENDTNENSVNDNQTNFAKDLINFNSDIIDTNNSKYNVLVGIAGIGAIGGSSAITDFLGEFSCCTSVGGVDPVENPARGMNNSFEVDFFRDTNGVQELEKICDFDNHRILGGGILQFIDLVKKNHASDPNFYDDYYVKLILISYR